jgi:hypothetical protein
MANLKIRVFKNGSIDPSTTVTIPGGILKVASNLIPNRAAMKLREEGVDLDELSRLADNPEAKGELVTIEDHDKNERVVIALE